MNTYPEAVVRLFRVGWSGLAVLCCPSDSLILAVFVDQLRLAVENCVDRVV